MRLTGVKTLKKFWGGELFETDCPQYISPTGKMPIIHKISINAVDRV